MTKIAILLPYEDMAETARKLIHENHYEIDYVKVIESENAVNEARIAAEQRGGYIDAVPCGYSEQDHACTYGEFAAACIFPDGDE